MFKANTQIQLRNNSPEIFGLTKGKIYRVENDTPEICIRADNGVLLYLRHPYTDIFEEVKEMLFKAGDKVTLLPQVDAYPHNTHGKSYTLFRNESGDLFIEDDTHTLRYFSAIYFEHEKPKTPEPDYVAKMKAFADETCGHDAGWDSVVIAVLKHVFNLRRTVIPQYEEIKDE